MGKNGNTERLWLVHEEKIKERGVKLNFRTKSIHSQAAGVHISLYLCDVHKNFSLFPPASEKNMGEYFRTNDLKVPGHWTGSLQYLSLRLIY